MENIFENLPEKGYPVYMEVDGELIYVGEAVRLENEIIEVEPVDGYKYIEAGENFAVIVKKKKTVTSKSNGGLPTRHVNSNILKHKEEK